MNTTKILLILLVILLALNLIVMLLPSNTAKSIDHPLRKGKGGYDLPENFNRYWRIPGNSRTSTT